MREDYNPDKFTWKSIAMKIINSMPTTTSKITMLFVLLLSAGIFFLPEWRYMAFASAVESAFRMSLLQELFLIVLLSWPGLLIALISMVRHYRKVEEKFKSLSTDLNLRQTRDMLDEFNYRAYGGAPKQLPHPLDGWRDSDF